MTRRRRRFRGRRWPWLAVVVVAAGALLWMLTSNRPQTPQQADAAGAGQAVGQTAPSVEPDPPTRSQPSAPRPTLRPRVSDLPPPRLNTSPPPSPSREPAAIEPQPAPPPVRAARPAAVTGADADAVKLYAQGMELIADGRIIESREVLSRLLFDPDLRLRPADAATARDALASINQHLVFGRAVNEDDPLVEQYTIQSGDYLVKIAPKFHLTAEFLQQINGIGDPRRIQVGQKLKVVRGPFHARIVKREYRLDVYLQDDMGEPVYVCSMPVGLGEGDSTPVGNWMVEPGRKIKNPAWTNPRTNERFAADDPLNPIGEYWIALKGTDPTTEHLAGYGIHGTIDPDSIGSQRSMGCVRLRDRDIEQVYNLLVPGQSTVQIVP